MCSIGQRLADQRAETCSGTLNFVINVMFEQLLVCTEWINCIGASSKQRNHASLRDKENHSRYQGRPR